MKRYTNALTLTALAFGMALVSAASGADAVLVGGNADCCQQGCGKTVCRPVFENKTVVKRVYTDRCTDVCLSGSLRGRLFHRGCGCSRVMKQKDLVVKLRKSEECVKKCVPVHEAACSTCAPACSAPCTVTPCAPPHQPSAPVGQPGIVVIPAATTMPAGPVAMPSAR